MVTSRVSSQTPTILLTATPRPIDTFTPSPSATIAVPTATPSITFTSIQSTPTEISNSNLAVQFMNPTLTGRPGELVTHTLTLTHLKSITDSYVVSAWVRPSHEFYIENVSHSYDSDSYDRTIKLGPNEKRDLDFVVGIPSYATNGMVNETYVWISGFHTGYPEKPEFTTVVSAPTSIQQISHIDAIAQDVFIQDTIAYVAAGNEGLQIFDISDPANPLELGRFNEYGGVWNVVAKKSYAYVAIGTCNDFADSDVRIYDKKTVECNSDLYVLDISNPAKPDIVTSYSLTSDKGESAWKWLEIFGNHIYVTDSQRKLNILDISEPSVPRSIDSLDIQVSNLLLTDNYLYVLSPSNFQFKEGGGYTSDSRVVVIDPVSSTIAGSFQLPEETPGGGMAVAGNLAYIYWKVPCLSGCTFDGWLTVDFSDPKNPKKMAVADYLPIQAQDTVTDNQYAYIAAGKTGLRILDITDPHNPIEIDAFNGSVPGMALGVDVIGDKIYLAQGTSGLFILYYPK